MTYPTEKPGTMKGAPIHYGLVKQVDHSAFLDASCIAQNFGEIVEKFRDPNNFIKAEKKEELPLIVPAEFVAGPLVRRTANNVVSVTMGVLEIDQGSVGEQGLTLDIVRQHSHVIHTSFSHDPDGQHKYHAFVELSREVMRHEWSMFFPRMLAYFKATEIADKKCGDPCHMYYLPGGDYARFKAEGSDGSPLDVEQVLALPRPEGFEPPKETIDYETVPEEERAEIGPGLREYWSARLINLVDAIERREFPGSIYDLKVFQVFGLAQGVPHIMAEERLFKAVVAALDYRYRKAGGLYIDSVEIWREKSIQQVKDAIADGMAKPWWPRKSDVVAVRPQTEIGVGERFLDQHGSDVRFIAHQKRWLVWDKRLWNEEIGGALAHQRMIETIRSIPSEADALHTERGQMKQALETARPDGDAKVLDQMETRIEGLTKDIEAVYKFARKCETRSMIAGGLTHASTVRRVIVTPDDLERNPLLFNVLNGTIDLISGKLHEHDKSALTTRMAMVEYDPKAECPRFMQFLREVFAYDEEMIDYVLRCLGYCLTGSIIEHCMFIAFGSGGNGKTTLLGAVHNVMGPYAEVAPPDMLMVERRDSHPTGRSSLFRKRLCSTMEIEEGRNLAEAEVKELTGGDPITTRRMYEDYWTFSPTHKLWMSTNHLPNVRGTDEGIWRRIRAIPFTQSFLGRESRNLPNSLRFEASGILALLVRSCKEWMMKGLKMPAAVEQSTAQYREAQDPIRPFLEGCFEIDPAILPLGPESLAKSKRSEYRVKQSTVWRGYRSWGDRTGRGVFGNARNLHGRLRELLWYHKSGVDYVYGIRPRSPDVDI